MYSVKFHQPVNIQSCQKCQVKPPPMSLENLKTGQLWIEPTGRNEAIVALCSLLSGISAYLCWSINQSDSWIENDAETMVVGSAIRSHGLWRKCVTEPSAISCEGVEKFWAALPIVWITARFFMTTAYVALALACALFYMSSGFTNFFCEASRLDYYFYKARPSKLFVFSLAVIINFICFIMVAAVIL